MKKKIDDTTQKKNCRISRTFHLFACIAIPDSLSRQPNQLLVVVGETLKHIPIRYMSTSKHLLENKFFSKKDPNPIFCYK